MLKRSCYVGVAEVGIYVSPLIRGCGVERALLDAPIESSETHGVWTLQAATIAPPTTNENTRQLMAVRATALMHG